MPTMTSSLLLLAMAAMCSLCLADTRMEFTTTPKVITEGITKSVQMTCSLNDMSKRADFSPDDVQTVTTMSIANAKGKTIANIHGDSAHVLLSKGGLTATGSLSGHAHLDLTFSNPAEMDTGVYKCQMVGLFTNHRTMILEKSWIVKTRDPKIDDVLARMEAQEKAIADLKKCSVKVGFMARGPGYAAIPSYETIVYKSILLNQGSGYDNSTGVFTCAVPGLYTFTVQARVNAARYVNQDLMLNSDHVTSLYAPGAAQNQYNTAASSALIQLKAGDRVFVKNDNYFVPDSQYLNIFQGNLVQADGCQH